MLQLYNQQAVESTYQHLRYEVHGWLCMEYFPSFVSVSEIDTASSVFDTPVAETSFTIQTPVSAIRPTSIEGEREVQ